VKIPTTILLLVTACFLTTVQLRAQGDAEIVNDPTTHAWDLFSKLNASVPNDPEGRVLWETWMLGRVVFADPNKAPVWNPTAPAARARATFEAVPLQQLIREQRRQGGMPGVIQPQFDPAVGANNETRMNKATFDFIVKNDLYYAQGIEAFATSGKRFDFPRDAMEVKAQWRPITAAQAARFHTAKVKGINGQEELWGLTAMHVTTKELPNWFWATFEHKDNAEHEGVLPDVKPQKQPASFQGTKWENYVLRGTQLEFTDSIGRPTRLASSQIEDGFQQTSSCISCHALASVNPQQGTGNRINFLEFFDQNGNGFVGVPDKQKFLVPGTENQMRYTQLDFVWSFFRAKRRVP
jgi:hypothetical protein